MSLASLPPLPGVAPRPFVPAAGMWLGTPSHPVVAARGLKVGRWGAGDTALERRVLGRRLLLTSPEDLETSVGRLRPPDGSHQGHFWCDARVGS